MKTKLFTLLLVVAASVGTMSAWDYERVQIGDLYYNLDATNHTVEVTYKSYTNYGFNEGWGITTANIPASVTYNEITYSVTSIGMYAFSYCSLTSVTIPNSVTSIGGSAFYGCTGLTSVTIGNSVTSIGESAFSTCTGLTSVTIPSSVTSIGYLAFYGCTGLTSINVASNNSNYCSVDGVLFNKDKITLIQYPGGKQSAYTIPNSVTSIGGGAFAGCSGLTSIEIPNSVTSIGGSAFYGCTGLTSIEIPNSVTSIGYLAFYGCTGLTSINVASDNSNYCSVDGVLFNKDKITLIQYPGGKQSAYTIPNSVTSIKSGAFYGCTGLTSLTIGNSVTSIGIEAFTGCSGLTSVTIPNSVTSIGNYAFYGCTGLTSMTIGNSVTSIGVGAFYGCSGLTSVTIPNSVTSIGNYAFYGCTGLTSVTNKATTPQAINTNVFTNVNLSACTLYVLAESVEAYQAADVWKEFGNILAIDDSTEEVNYATLADIYNMAADSTFTLGAFDVMYVPDFQSGSNMYIKDSTGSCVIYKVNYGLQAGDHVEAGLQGKVSIYNGLHEVIPITAKEDLIITHGEAPAPIVATEAPSLNNASQYVVYEGVSFTTDTAFVEGRRHTVYGSWNGQTITFYNQYYIGATLSANKTYNITAVNTIYRTTPQAYPLVVEEVSPAPCIIASGTCGAEGDNLTWTLACDSVLTISGTGAMADYISPFDIPWYTYRNAIKSVVIGNSVTSIVSSAFYNCSSLTTITNYAATPQTISSYVFTNVNISSCTLYVPAQSVAAYQAADVWKDFETILPIDGTVEVEVDTITVAQALEIGSTLAANVSTDKQYTIRGYVSAITTPFSEQYLNQTFYIADDSLSTARSNAEGGFYVYRGKPITGQPIKEGALVELTTAIKNYNNRTIENAVQNVLVTVLEEGPECRILSGTCGENLTWTFNNCDSVLTISGTGAMEDYNSDDSAPWFSFKYTLDMSVVIEEGVTYIGKDAFAYYGVGIKSVTIPSSVISIGNKAFISSATAFFVDEANPNYSSLDGVLFNKDQTTLIYYPVAKRDTQYTIPNTVNTIGHGAFYGCDYLNSIIIPNSVTAIEGSAFRYCRALKSVSIPNSVLTIGYDAFEYCDNLVTANISSSVTSIGNSAFAGCKQLQSINVDEANLYYCSIDGVLFNKDQTKLLQYPNGKGDTLYIIPNTVTTLGSMSFSYILKKDSVKLTSIVIPSSVTTINADAFWDANDLASITNYAVTPQWVSAPYAHISSCTLYVPAQSLEAYQAADFWKDFANILPIEGTETPIETVEGNYTIYYVGKDSQDLTDEIVTLHVPVAPVIEGFTFVEWRVAEGSLSFGITIQAIYEANEPTSAPEVYTNPANPAQKLIRNGNVYILTDDKIYSITGQEVR